MQHAHRVRRDRGRRGVGHLTRTRLLLAIVIWISINSVLSGILWAATVALTGRDQYPWIGALILFALQALPGSGTQEASVRVSKFLMERKA